jgi:hypothetical protein
MTVLLVSGLFIAALVIGWRRRARRAALADRGPGITWVPQLGWCAQDGGTLIDPAGPETRAVERDLAVWAKQNPQQVRRG